MSARLTTHVLDTVSGCPARGLKIELHFLDRDLPPKAFLTNIDGRTDEPLLCGAEMIAGIYEIIFHVGEYFGQNNFLDAVPVRFKIDDPARSYHVPLLCTPWSYSTYRGS